MHPLKGRKQSPEHVAKRALALRKVRKLKHWIGGRPANTPDILWSKVLKLGPQECWPWQGYRKPDGYGRTWINDRGYYAHRVIYCLAHPGVTTMAAPKSCHDPHFIRHTCDNPRCCNPAHMLLGTQKDNVADMHERGRAPDFRGVKGGTAKLTEHDVREIRRMKREGATITALTLLYEVSRSTICGCLYGRHYQDVT